jgi:hypothetical protein
MMLLYEVSRAEVQAGLLEWIILKIIHLLFFYPGSDCLLLLFVGVILLFILLSWF